MKESHKNKSGFDTPILFIVYNRMHTAKKVFQIIREMRPQKLFIASDGPKADKPEDHIKINTLRNYLLENVDWDCAVSTRFRENNLGCKYGPETAVTWFFENVEQGIVLEDDCLPSPSFFDYCENLLSHYQEDLRVFFIGGTNHLETVDIDNSYYYSHFYSIWGWASWRSRWQIHLETLKDFERISTDNLVHNKLKNKAANKNLIKNAIRSVNDETDCWDFQWALTCLINSGFVIVPRKNLIENIGYGSDATHTTNEIRKKVPKLELQFPLRHPSVVIANEEYDNVNYRHVMGWISNYQKITNPLHIWAMIKYRMKRIPEKISGFGSFIVFLICLNITVWV